MSNPVRKEKPVFVFPTVSLWGKFLQSLLKIFGFRTYYRDKFYKELLSAKPSDLWYLSIRALGQFQEVAVRPQIAKKVARIFSVNADSLLAMGRELVFKRMENDFHFAYLVACGQSKTNAQFVFPLSKRLRLELARIFKTEPEGLLAGGLSTLVLLIERIKLVFVSLIKTFFAIFRLIIWRLSGPSVSAGRIRGNYLWLPGGPTEISLDPEKLSLPLYLEELSECSKPSKRHFAVICPFLEKSEYWDKPHSFSIPNLRDIPPGLSWASFFEGMRALLKLLICIPIFAFFPSEEMELLSLLPFLFLKKAWLKDVGVSAVFVTESCAGAASPLVHSARELQIPIVMVFYSTDVRPMILDKTNEDIIPVEFRHLLADHLCVWTPDMKSWFEYAGYPKESIHVVGPQMFSSYVHGDNGKREKEVTTIALFDYFPPREDMLLRFGLGESIIDTQFCINFRKMIFEAIREIYKDNLRLVLKMKRKPDDAMDDNWSKEMIDNYADLSRHLIIKNFDANPWLVLNEADIVIALPYTSPGKAGLAMGKPSAFFDPTGLILPRPQETVPLLSGSAKLHQWLSDIKSNPVKGAKASSASKFGASQLADTLQKILPA